MNFLSYKFLFLCEIMMLEKIILKILDCVEYVKLYRNIKFLSYNWYFIKFFSENLDYNFVMKFLFEGCK